ncbi:MAG: hypothetical protein ACJAT7_003738 [Psychromonas sp.]|jgi:hypothetical protein
MLLLNDALEVSKIMSKFNVGKLNEIGRLIKFNILLILLLTMVMATVLSRSIGLFVIAIRIFF